MICKNCGTECNDGVKFCVACGAPMEAPVAAQPTVQAQPVNAQPVNAQPAKKPVDALAIVALIAGILSILSSLCCGSSAIPGIAAIICGALSKKKGKNTMATVGLVLGIAGLVIGLIAGILMFAFGFFGGLLESLSY